MPIPFIIAAAGWAVGAVATGYAGKKGYDAYKNHSSAKETVENAQKKFEEAKSLLEKKQEETQQSLDELEKYKSEVLENQIGHVISVVTKFKSKLAGFAESFDVESLNDRHGDADVSLNTGENAKDMAQGELNEAIKGGTANAATGGIASFEKMCDQFGKTPVADESLSSGYLTHLKNAFTGFFDDDDTKEEDKENNASASDNNNNIEEPSGTESVMGDMATKIAKNHLKNVITGFFNDDDDIEDDEEVEDSEISASENITEKTDKEEESVIGSIAKAAVKEAVIAAPITSLVIGGAFVAFNSVIGIGDKFTEETEKNLTKSKEYEAEVDKACEQMASARTNLEAVRINCDEITYIIEKLVEWFEKYQVDNMDDEDKLKHMLIIGKTLKDVLNEPLINKDGTAVNNLKDKCSEYLGLNYSKFSQTKII